MALINCSQCGKEISDMATDCIHCGCIIEKVEKKMVCSECGSQVYSKSNVCNYCGSPNINEINTTNSNSMLKNKMSSCREREILSNVSKIESIAVIIKVFLIILLGICIFLMFFCIANCVDNSDNFGSIVLLFLSIISMAIIGIVMYSLDTFIKWKAYMLETNYYIYKNK